jgi:hypothetical protein
VSDVLAILSNIKSVLPKQFIVVGLEEEVFVVVIRPVPGVVEQVVVD